MQNCLGIYIEGKIIKYAKISKDRDNIKIESFGTKIYEDITQTITQIVQETSSEKTPVAVNLTGEYYDYFDLFALLSEKDLRKYKKRRYGKKIHICSRPRSRKQNESN